MYELLLIVIRPINISDEFCSSDNMVSEVANNYNMIKNNMEVMQKFAIWMKPDVYPCTNTLAQCAFSLQIVM